MDNSVIILIVVVVMAILLYQVITLKRKADALKKEVVCLEGQVHSKAQEQFHTWQQKECEAIRLQQIEVARREARAKLEEWKFNAEGLIRHDAIQRSQSVIVGKVTEHLIPYLPQFIYNPKDARFIGSPVDLIVFDGLDNGYLENIVFIEVKTGSASRLTRREQQIKDAIEKGRVKWVKMKVNHNKGEE